MVLTLVPTLHGNIIKVSKTYTWKGRGNFSSMYSASKNKTENVVWRKAHECFVKEFATKVSNSKPYVFICVDL